MDASSSSRATQVLAEMVDGVTTNNKMAFLCHEGTQVTDITGHDDIDTFHRDAASRAGVAFDDQRPAVSGCSRILRRVALDPDLPRHDVLSDTRAGIADYRNVRLLVHAGAVVADVAVYRYVDIGIDATGNAVPSTGVHHRQLAGRLIVQVLIEMPHRVGIQIERRHQ